MHGSVLEMVAGEGCITRETSPREATVAVGDIAGQAHLYLTALWTQMVPL